MSYLARIAEVYQGLAFSRQELAYYARHVLLPGVGTPGQKKLKAARVLVVGAGGLGCPVLQGIVGAGAGYVTVIDGDSVEWSNLSRQWLHGVDTVGQ
ncbi:MAG: HesA/MoeB/ThiF family protein, partial [Coraliomargarita sp.]